MSRARVAHLPEPPPDPFGERRHVRLWRRMRLLGGQFRFETDSRSLLRLVQQAYARVPPQAFAGAAAPRFLVRLALIGGENARRPSLPADEPAPVRPLAGAGIVCGAMESASFVALTPPQRSGLVVVSPQMLRFPYHVRYELLEFAVYVLAARAQRLVPLHAACVGRGKRGILLLGPSGSGKSTLALHCLLQGLTFLAEDSVLVRPRGLLATGVANFLHLRPDSLRFLDAIGRARVMAGSSLIRRRSGVEKLEIDLRRTHYRLAPAPLAIRAVVFVSQRRARSLLVPLGVAEVRRRLAISQRYAAQQAGWDAFMCGVARLPAFELRRGSHPRQSAEALEQLLSAGSLARRRRRSAP